MKKIEAWKTSDGKVWETEVAAEMHEKRITGEEKIRNIYYTGMVDCGNDLIDFLDQHILTILDFYGRA
ncbi:hypothetical protein LCGC14_0814980 [marine sediment metagenome]|uniref:Uncharacterized protein n=1 Tax=marine sediment metagenome TaxID=412755 RepID=A0A0F9ST62_9ZZZZ